MNETSFHISVSISNIYNIYIYVFTFQVIIEEMLKTVIKKYVKMGGCQYLRDYRMAQRLKKTAELRKRVMERNKKSSQKSDSIPFQVSH